MFDMGEQRWARQPTPPPKPPRPSGPKGLPPGIRLARTHGDLRRRFFTLLSEHEGGAPDADVMARLTMIYADEPPVIRRLNRRAHNHAGMTLYGDDFTKA